MRFFGNKFTSLIVESKASVQFMKIRFSRNQPIYLPDQKIRIKWFGFCTFHPYLFLANGHSRLKWTVVISSILWDEASSVICFLYFCDYFCSLFPLYYAPHKNLAMNENL